MPKQKLVRCEIWWDKKAEVWCYRENGAPRRRMYPITATAPGLATWQLTGTKAGFISAVVRSLRKRVKAGEYGFTLRIHKKNGEFQEERTYPRSRDSRSKG